MIEFLFLCELSLYVYLYTFKATIDTFNTKLLD